MARAGALPAILGRVSSRQTPLAGTIVIGAVVSGFVLLGDLEMVARISTFAILISFGLVNLSLAWVLIKEAHGLAAALRQPFGLFQPLLAAAACAWLAAEVGWTAFAAGALLGGLGLVIGSFISRRRRAEANGRW
jgi:APA family basic amino acid/polyamine antiporter